MQAADWAVALARARLESSKAASRGDDRYHNEQLDKSQPVDRRANGQCLLAQKLGGGPRTTPTEDFQSHLHGISPTAPTRRPHGFRPTAPLKHGALRASGIVHRRHRAV